MNVNIDNNSGFCFGVIYSIEVAERVLEEDGELFCLGDIVHNEVEISRLKEKGLKIIDYDEFKNLKNTSVLIRAHGEHPSTYRTAMENNIKLIDASCPVVLKLQNKLQKGFMKGKAEDDSTQTVIYGKEGHAEVKGLSGQTMDSAIIINDISQVEDNIDFSRPIQIYSQTTQSMEKFFEIVDLIKKRAAEESDVPMVSVNDTICREVSNRAPHVKEFSKNHDVIVFVSGTKSSNGKYLYGVAKESNPNTYFISHEDELKAEWFKKSDNVGISGATSTPSWLMEKVSERIREIVA